MGIIIRQSILTSVISYLGVIVGYINVAYLFPKFLEPEQVGLLRTIVDTSMLFVPFAVVGLGQSIIKFYPRYSHTDRQANGFITMILLMSILTLSLFMMVFVGFEDAIMNFFKSNAKQLIDFKNLILSLTFLLVLITLLEQYSRSLFQIAFPSFLREVGIRLLQVALVFLYYYGYLNFSSFVGWNVWIYLLTLAALVLFLLVKGGLKVNTEFLHIPLENKKEILVFSLLSFVGTSAMIIIGKMDSVMVSGMIGLKANAVYTTALYIATVIEIPKRAITTTASTVIARAFAKHDIKEVTKIYQKTSINQYIIGALLLIGVYANLHNIFSLMPRSEIYAAGSAVILVIGAGKLIDMIFGPSSEIIGLSNHYWFNLVVITVLAVLNLVGNYFLIPRYGITGAAYSSLFSLFIYNTAKFIFIKAKFDILPFTMATIKVTIISAVCVALNFILPVLENVFLDILLRSSVITLVFGSLILFSNSSEEVTKVWGVGVNFLRRKP
jgi:O-antigen/teichoic acid export membrane protein